MAVNIGPRIGVDGEAQYRAQINNIVQATKTLKAEMEQTAQEFKRSGDAMGGNKAKAEQLTKAIELQRDKVDKLRDMTAKAAEKYGEADTRTLKWKEALAQAQTELSRLEGEMGNVSPKVKALADTLAEAGNKLKAIGDKAQKVGKTLTKRVTGPIVAAFGGALKVTADFDESMSKVAAVSGAVGEDFDKLRAKAREMGEKTKFSASEAADAMNYMAMAGWKTEEMLSGVEGIMNLAAASGEDLATTSDIVTDALTAFGMSAGDSGRLADILAAASSNANTNVSMLGESFKYAAPVAGALGSSAEDTAVALGLMANAGIKASQGGTALRTGLSNLVNPSDKMAAAMDRYNVALVENADGTINLRDTMKLLRDRLGGLTESEQAAAASTIFGKNAMSGWLAIINAAPEDFDKLTGAIDASEGAAQNMADVMNDNLSGQAKILKSKVEELAISFGDILTPYAIKAADWLQRVADRFNGLSEGAKKTIIVVAGIAAVVGPALIVIGKIASAVGSIMSLAPQITAAIGTASAFVSSTLIPALSSAAAAFAPFLVPAGLIVAGIVAATVLIVKNWDNIKKGAAKLKEGVAKAWEWFKVQLPKIVNLILPGPMLIIKNWDKLKAAAGVLKTNVVNAWNNLKTGVVNKATALKQGAEDKLNALKEKAKNIAGNIKEGVVGRFNALKESAVDKVKSLKDKTVDAMNSAKDKLKSIADSIKDGVVGKFESLKDGVVSKVTSAKEKISSVFGEIKSIFNTTLKPKVKLPHIRISGKFSINPPEVPKLSVDWYRKAYNNPLMFSTPTIVGGRGFGDGAGGEIVIGKDTMLAWIRDAVNGGGTTTNNSTSYGDINVVVNAAPGQNVRELADLVADRIQQQVSMRRRAT